MDFHPGGLLSNTYNVLKWRSRLRKTLTVCRYCMRVKLIMGSNESGWTIGSPSELISLLEKSNEFAQSKHVGPLLK